MKKFILFDLGGVVNEYSEELYYDYLYRLNGFTKKQVDMALGKSVNRIESGSISLTEFERQVAKRFSIRSDQVKWMEFFKRMARLDDDVIGFIKDLKPNYKIAFLSNIDKWRYKYAMGHIYKKVLWLFDYRFASFKLGMVKPDPRIYWKVLKAMDAKPSEVVFVDNIARNVRGARSVGITSVHFTGIKKLKVQLKRLGIKF
jgi:putative hydrolase of the HAD superfamily